MKTALVVEDEAFLSLELKEYLEETGRQLSAAPTMRAS